MKKNLSFVSPEELIIGYSLKFVNCNYKSFILLKSDYIKCNDYRTYSIFNKWDKFNNTAPREISVWNALGVQNKLI